MTLPQSIGRRGPPSFHAEDIVTHVLAGQTAWFELLMRRYNERLYRAARAFTRDDREAKDVMQQAYVNAFANLRQFKGRRSSRHG
jgi:RNA polymerase sigma-70 factor (ECF subfamily)